MSALFANNATTTLTVAINATATSLTVADGGAFPTPTGSDYFTLTLTDYVAKVYEIVHCTARSGNTLTVVRGQEGTTQELFPIGAQVENRPTAATLNRIDNKAVNDLVDVTAPSPAPNDALTWDGTKWVAQPATAVSALDDLTDVSVPAPNTGDALVYNGSIWAAAQNGSVAVSSESTVTPLKLAVVPALPSVPDSNTIYFVL